MKENIAKIILLSWFVTGVLEAQSMPSPTELFPLKTASSTAQLRITKTDNSTQAVPGLSVIYTIVASNLGPDTATEVSVTDDLPPNLTCAWTSEAAGGATGNSSTGTGSVSQSLEMPTASSVTYIVVCDLDSAATGTLSNTATISSPAMDPEPSDNSATDGDTVLTPRADLQLFIDETASMLPKEELVYRLRVTNRGPSVADNVVVDSVFGPGSTLTAVSGCETPSGEPSCSLGRLQVGASRSITIAAAIEPDLVGTLIYEASASSNAIERNPGDESVTVTTEIAGEADLLLTLSGPGTAVPGENVEYLIEVANEGPRNITGARVLDFFPPAMADATWTCAVTGAGSCPSGTGNIDARIALNVGAVARFAVIGKVSPDAVGVLDNTAFVVSGTGVIDPNPINNRATATTRLRVTADLSVMVDDGRDEVIPGKELTYTISVLNKGPSAVSGASWMGNFPFTEVASPLTFMAQASEVFSLSAGASQTFQVQGLVQTDESGTAAVQVALELPQNTDDPDPADNQFTDTNTLISGQVRATSLPATLSLGEGPDLAFDSSGRSLVVFEQNDGEVTRIVGQHVDASGRLLGSPMELSVPGRLSPAVAFDARLDPSDLAADPLAEGFEQSSTKEDFEACQDGAMGACLTVWQEADLPSRILGQRSRGGARAGSEMEFSTRSTSQAAPDVASMPEGGFLVVWESAQENGGDTPGASANESGIFGRLTDRFGHPLAPPEQRLNSAMRPDPQRPAVASAGTSGFLVVWDAPRGARREVVGQRLNTAGQPLRAEIRLTVPPGSQIDPDVAFSASLQRFLVVWREPDSGDGGIGGQLIDVDGAAMGEPFLIGKRGDFQPSVATDAEKANFIVVWERPFGNRSRSLAQLVNAQGQPQDPAVPLRNSAGGRQLVDRGSAAAPDKAETGERPAVAFAPRGSSLDAGSGDLFFIVWGDQLSGEVLGQRYVVTADLVLAAFDDPDPVLPGDTTLTYRVQITNISTADAEDVVATHALLEGLTLVESVGCAEDPAALTTCTLGTVPAKSTLEYVLKTRVDPALRGTLPLSVNATSSTPDPDDADNSDTIFTTLGQADLSIDLSGGAGPVALGDRMSWTVTVRNTGPSLAEGVVITAPVPLGVLPIESTGCLEDPSGMPTCTLDTLDVGDERQVEMTVEIGEGRRDSSTQTVSTQTVSTQTVSTQTVSTQTVSTQTVSVTSDLFDSDLSNNSASRDLVTTAADLTVEIEAPSVVVASQSFRYAVTVTNRGSTEAEDIVVLTPLPPGLTLLASRGCVEDPEGVPRCSLGTLESSSSRQYTLDVQTDASISGTLTYGVSATSTDAMSLPTASVETRVTPSTLLPLLGGRFEVRAQWRTPQGAGSGRAIPFSDNTGLFWFFDADNVELVTNILDGGAVNNHFWFFHGALSDVEYDIQVIDTVTGVERNYHNPAGNLCGQGDTSAFPVTTSEFLLGKNAEAKRGVNLHPPLKKAERGFSGLCAPGPETLCLSAERFRVEVAWRNQHDGGTEGMGRATAGTDSTGHFWFFNPKALDLAVKVLDGTALNGKFWVFHGGLSDVEYWITVTDTTDGTSRTYHNPPGEICGQADLDAF